MIFPFENRHSINIVTAAYKYADEFELAAKKHGYGWINRHGFIGSALKIRCLGLVRQDRFLSYCDSDDNVEIRRMV